MIRDNPGEKTGDPLPPLADMLAEARRADLPYRPFRAGVEVHWLRESSDGPSAAVLRYAAGASVPAHRHEGEENVYVISGAQQDQRGVYRAGAHAVNAPGSSHTVTSPEGCVVLVVWSRPNQWLD
jgi:anti-sigma factor ChrR (cupin superfamily)